MNATSKIAVACALGAFAAALPAGAACPVSSMIWQIPNYSGVYTYVRSPGLDSPATYKGSFWALGFGNPANGVGHDNGSLAPWDGASGWLHQYPGVPTYLFGDWGSDPRIDGCAILQPVAQPSRTVVMLTDQNRAGQIGYYAAACVQVGQAGHFNFSDGLGGRDIELVPIPRPRVLAWTGLPNALDIVLDLPSTPPVQQDGTCGSRVITGYKIYQRMLPWMYPGDGADRVRDADWTLAGGPFPLGAPQTIRVHPPYADEVTIYLATTLVLDSGFETGHVSQSESLLYYPYCEDYDGDGHHSAWCGGDDCEDLDSQIHPGAPERCNALDDDCDGQTDEGIVPQPTTCGIGGCARTGQAECVGGVVRDTCTPGTPTAEICNGIDDDCDGTTDEVCNCAFSKPISSGWTFVAPAVHLGYNAESMCGQINVDGGSASEINRWLSGAWEGHVCGRPFQNWPVEDGRGQFVRSAAASTWCQLGGEIPSPLSLSLVNGWSTVSRPRWAGSRTAEQVCAEIRAQGGCPAEIDRWASGAWEGHVCGLPFNNFLVEPGTGYFVWATCASTYVVDRQIQVSNQRRSRSW